MKKMFILTIAALLLFPMLASAKTVAYVTSQTPATEKCSDLSGEDLLFCSELERLGYSVVAKNEMAVVNNLPDWGSLANKADLIFLGNVSMAVANTSEFQSKFCKFVFYSDAELKFPRGKPIFSTGLNSFRNSSEKILGCGAQAFFLYSGSTYTANSNLCEKNIFKKQKEGYITDGLPQIIALYSQEAPAKISNKSQQLDPSLEAEIWVGDECTPAGGSQLSYFLYPSIFTTKKGAFWGPDTPSKFTNTTWKIFDRTILYMLNDRSLEAKFFTLPETPSKGEKFFLLANISHNGKPVENGTAYTWLDSAKYSLNYNNVSRLWEAAGISIEKATSANFFSKTEDELRFFNETKEIPAGGISVSILSPEISAGKTALRAEVSGAGLGTQVKYKLWSENFTVLFSGNMELKDGIFLAQIAAAPKKYFIEVTASDSSGKLGGAYREITEKEKLEAGKDFFISPNEWMLSYAEGKTFSQSFSFKPLYNITNLKLTKAGGLSKDISLNLENVSSSVSAGSEVFFTAALNAKNYTAGTYAGKILLEADSISAEIPVELILDPAIKNSDWFTVNPKAWKSTIPKGKTQKKNFTLIPLGIYHANEIRFEGTDDFKNLLKAQKIDFIKSRMEKEIFLELDTANLDDGIYKGDILVYSSIGGDSISTEIRIAPDFSAKISELESNISEMESRIDFLNNSGIDLAAANQKLAEAKQAIEDVKQKFSAQDYDGAKAAIPLAEQRIVLLSEELASLKEPFPIIYIVIFIIIIIAAFLIYKFKDKILGLFKKKKISVPEEGEEGYSGGSDEKDEGYRPQYY